MKHLRSQWPRLAWIPELPPGLTCVWNQSPDSLQPSQREVKQCAGVCSLSDGASNGSDSKKLRVEEAPPSRVLHIRKLPNEATETEIIALGLPFGKVTNILTLKGKNQVKEPDCNHSLLPCRRGPGPGALTVALCLQAFLEMGTEEAAITMVNYYATVTPHVRNVPVFIQYSNHKELKTDAGNQVGAG